MRSALIPALAVTAVALAPASSEARTVEEKYSALYHQVRTHMGKRAPGRNIRRWGVRYDSKANGRRGPWKTRHATTAELKRSNRTFERWLAPPPASVRRGDRPSLRGVPPHRAGGGYSIPRDIVMCESGGDYGAVNPSSGARGAYQVLPSTHAALCPDLDWSPPGQDQCASRVWAVQGRGAWVC